MRNRLVLAGFVVATAILAFVGWQSYRNTARFAEASEWQKHTYEVLRNLDETVARLVDAETGQRGYLLTGDTAYLEPYSAAIKDINETIGHLKSLTSDNPNQQKRIQNLEPMVEIKLAELQLTIDLRKNEGLAAASGMVLEGSGKHWMDQIRAVVADMKREEEQLLTLRTQRTNESVARSLRAILAGTLLSISLLAFCFGFLLRELAERKKAQGALTKREKWFSTTLASIGDAVIAADMNGAVTFMNSAAQSLTGWNQEEAIGKSLDLVFDIVNKETRRPVENPVKKVFRKGKVVGLANHTLLLCKGGKEFDIEDSAAPILTDAGDAFGVVLVFRDVTGRKRSEDLMRAKEELERASKFKDQFLSTMSHELRTPLNAVLGFSDLLADERYGPLNDRQQRYVAHIHTGGEHLLKLISDILDLSKIEAGRLELVRTDFTVASAFAEVISGLYPLAEKKSQALLQQVAPNLHIHADPMRFKQVLMNLAGNAIKFTPEGGRIELAAFQVDNQVTVEVRDNGPGVPPEQQQRIFEPFVRLPQSGAAPEGTGLGLAITARLLKLHGSKLQIASKPGESTCFYFSLPLIAATQDRPTQTPVPMPKTGKAPRVLVVEDDAAKGQLIQSQLTSSGYESVLCGQLERAMEMAAEHQPDAITLDLLMQPVHGLEVLLQLKNDPRTSKIPIIVVTIVDQAGAGTALGADEYLIKPVDQATLLATVERCIRSRGGAATKTILVVEDDVSTLKKIVELLNGYGYAVSTAMDAAQARASVARSLPELVILDLVLPTMSGFELLAEWRATPRTADLSVFVLTSNDLTKQEEEYLHAHAESLFRKQNAWREPLIKQLERVVTSFPLELA